MDGAGVSASASWQRQECRERTPGAAPPNDQRRRRQPVLRRRDRRVAQPCRHDRFHGSRKNVLPHEVPTKGGVAGRRVANPGVAAAVGRVGDVDVAQRVALRVALERAAHPRRRRLQLLARVAHQPRRLLLPQRAAGFGPAPLAALQVQQPGADVGAFAHVQRRAAAVVAHRQRVRLGQRRNALQVHVVAAVVLHRLVLLAVHRHVLAAGQVGAPVVALCRRQPSGVAGACPERGGHRSKQQQQRDRRARRASAQQLLPRRHTPRHVAC